MNGVLQTLVEAQRLQGRDLTHVRELRIRVRLAGVLARLRQEVGGGGGVRRSVLAAAFPGRMHSAARLRLAGSRGRLAAEESSDRTWQCC